MKPIEQPNLATTDRAGHDGYDCRLTPTATHLSCGKLTHHHSKSITPTRFAVEYSDDKDTRRIGLLQRPHVGQP
jgi:hypothetical protein